LNRIRIMDKVEKIGREIQEFVLATDLSPAWDEILACAGEFKALGCSRVILTYVTSVKFMAGMEGLLLLTARPKLEAQQQQLEAQGVEVMVETPVGPAGLFFERRCRSILRRSSRGRLPWAISLA
jgi:hypothetical protein